MICFNTKTLNGRPMTVGDYLLYPWSEADLNGALNAEAAKRKELYDKGINADVYRAGSPAPRGRPLGPVAEQHAGDVPVPVLGRDRVVVVHHS